MSQLGEWVKKIKSEKVSLLSLTHAYLRMENNSFKTRNISPWHEEDTL